MKLALYLIMAVAPIAAVDVVYFHLWKYKLYERVQSASENVTHAIRAVLFIAALSILLHARPQGAWYWAVALLFGVDFVNTLIDVFLEPRSRAPGVVPRLELLTHTTGTTFAGGAWVAFVVGGFDARLEPTALVPHPEGYLPAAVLWAGRLMLAIAIGLFVLETALALRAAARRRGIARPPSRSAA